MKYCGATEMPWPSNCTLHILENIVPIQLEILRNWEPNFPLLFWSWQVEHFYIERFHYDREAGSTQMQLLTADVSQKFISGQLFSTNNLARCLHAGKRASHFITVKTAVRFSLFKAMVVSVGRHSHSWHPCVLNRAGCKITLYLCSNICTLYRELVKSVLLVWCFAIVLLRYVDSGKVWGFWPNILISDFMFSGL